MASAAKSGLELTTAIAIATAQNEAIRAFRQILLLAARNAGSVNAGFNNVG